jgi:hypothetical protein
LTWLHFSSIFCHFNSAIFCDCFQLKSFCPAFPAEVAANRIRARFFASGKDDVGDYLKCWNCQADFTHCVHSIVMRLSATPIYYATYGYVTMQPSRVTRDRCYDFLNIFAEKFGKKMAFWLKTKLNYAKC